MRILLSGSSGLIGSAFACTGHEIVRLVRPASFQKGKSICWTPDEGVAEPADFEGFDAVVHLAGESIRGLWTKKKKQTLFTSRCRNTWLLAETLSRCKSPPKVFLSASAIGYYGNRGDEILTESSPPGKGFLAELCIQWERAAQPLARCGTRLVYPRFGLVLSPEGGALRALLPIYRMGLGAILGSGDQQISWIALEDALRALDHLLTHSELSGPVNLVAPQVISQRAFATALAEALHRHIRLRLPAPLLHLLPGEIADNFFLTSQHVLPEQLQKTGFSFLYLDLKRLFNSVL